LRTLYGSADARADATVRRVEGYLACLVLTRMPCFDLACLVLKGRGFKPRRKLCGMNGGFSR